MEEWRVWAKAGGPGSMTRDRTQRTPGSRGFTPGRRTAQRDPGPIPPPHELAECPPFPLVNRGPLAYPQAMKLNVGRKTLPLAAQYVSCHLQTL